MSTSFTEPSAIDLHAHSTASDGVLAPAELVARAAARGVRCLALTDHDTTCGLDEARNAADAHGVRLIPGIELSAAHDGKPLHIVGLGIDPDAPALHLALGQLATLRAERAKRIGAKLAKLGIADSYEGACAEAGTTTPGRAHFSRWLLGRGLVADHAQAFDRLLGRGKPAFVATAWPALAETVACIVGAGGVAVLAHPLRYKFTASWLRRIAADFREMGGQGIEVSIARQSAAELDLAANVARRHGLMGSVGSDFHAPGKHAAELGGFARLPADIEPVWSLLSAA